MLQDCAAKFPVAVGLVNVDRPAAQDKFVLAAPATSPTDQLRVIVALAGDSITTVRKDGRSFFLTQTCDILLLVYVADPGT